MSAHGDLAISREPLSLYGSLETMVRGIRARRPMDLSAESWHREQPEAPFLEWQALARACLLDGLHYDPGPLDLQPEVLDRDERADLVVERVAFNTTPWNRVEGYFLVPKDAERPLPGLVAFHAWGGPMLFGKERLVNTGRDHPILAEHRDKVYGGRYLAEELARQGYAVIVIDAHHFGRRAPRDLNGIPPEYDPFDLDVDQYTALENLVRDQLYLGVRQLNWAGTTWMGVFYWDDSRCIDYLLTRPEVDGNRIGCTGLSVGGWRTNVLAALDPRVNASVSVGWMTTGYHQQVYNVAGAVGTFALLPGVWDRLDIPDLTIMAVPGASMVVSGTQDQLFPPEGQQEAARQIRAGYEWAGCREHFRNFAPPKPHCYDPDIQAQAFAWLDQHLK